MTATISFLVPVQEDLRAVETLMREQAADYHPDLAAAMDLIISAGGKRIRPAMTFLIGKMLHAPWNALLSLATSIEMLHTGTLVHDDLIDGSLLRRGMPTLNSKWTPGATVLTGDFVLARAAKLAAETESIPVIKLFAHTLTVIVNGEIDQLLGSKCLADREKYLKRIYAKTASVFETSAQSAAIIAGAADEIVESLRRYGYEIGMAFQIIDDILDFTAEQTTMGKPVGSDLHQGIITLPTLLYVESHPDDIYAKLLMSGKCLTEEQISRMIESIRQSDAIRRSHQEAVDFIERGLESLCTLPPSPERFALEELANYIVERKF